MGTQPPSPAPKERGRGAGKPRNGPFVETVQRLEGSPWWERFVKEVGIEPIVKKEGVMDGESGELTKSEEVVGA